jgi:tetratricopeptide (TPR) repeat protein
VRTPIAPQRAPVARGLARASADAVNRRLIIAILSMTIVVLAVVGWMVYAVIALTAAPRTAVERQVMTLENLSRSEPTNGQVWADWAKALMGTGDLSRAADVIARGSEVASDTAPIELAEASLLVKQGRPGDALDLLNKLVASLLKAEATKVKELAAVGTVLSADALTSQFLVDAQILRGEVLTQQKRPTDAIAAYSFALTRDGQMADVLVMRADLYASTGANDKAETDYRKALTMLPDYAPAIEGLKRLGKAATK